MVLRRFCALRCYKLTPHDDWELNVHRRWMSSWTEAVSATLGVDCDWDTQGVEVTLDSSYSTKMVDWITKYLIDLYL
jgi:hypothetical protein